MDESRRLILMTAALAGAAPLAAGSAIGREADGMAAALGISALPFGLRPNTEEDQSARLAAALAEAARRSAPLLVPPGRYRIAAVALPDGARLVGAPGLTTFVHAGSGPMLTARNAQSIALYGLRLDGLSRPLPDRAGLVTLAGVREVEIDGCRFEKAGGIALHLAGCGGRVTGSAFSEASHSALFSIDATGLSITANTVTRCGSNGIQVWRSEKGDDGTVVAGNRISHIAADAGGTGEYGNGISIFRAGGVLVSGNTVRDCALSAIRNNSGSACQIIGNNCARLGETALWAEFAFEGTIIANNVVEEAMSGISMTNLDHGGRLSVCSGNLLRGLRHRPRSYDGVLAGGTGIHVEAEASVTGNVIEDAEDKGISVGWSWAMRNIAVTGNVIRNARTGIRVSLVPKERSAVISGNVISGAREGAVVGYEYDKAVTGDLTARPDARATGIVVTGNAVA
ncbi:twin-arg-translocated uncharacterized repeat protein [Chelatococcus sambhunathii]|uniref:TIGR03808 family TAT-translocated repetitive protein n=2 Tax=Chelatococcus TaxID=28209 RepID=A0AAC9JS41_9HYPH|nr:MULTISPECIES: TIGR03808 family TAT-translocated repetitive protein [Chelatococcus]APF37374.1 hypothetical protein BOQ54_08560 [Chelatococcus daeguensis]CUA86539.1 twin-arg-translocated uncharacterized repeat protein [Chelatococcus sambhunathii]